MISSVILEDEEDAQFLLSTILKDYCPEIKVEGMAANKEDGLALIREKKPKLVFCDIQLEDCHVFEILDELGIIDFQVIFTTAYDQYALKAFEYNALHYILKPYSPQDVKESLRRIDHSLLSPLPSTSHETKSNIKKLPLKTTEGVHLIDVDSIIRVQAERSYSHIFYGGGKKLVVSRPLKDIQEKLEHHQFFRVHNSHLISIHQVDQVDKESKGTISMVDGSSVPLSRSRRKDFLEAIQ